jgi:hypothetical protein
MKARSDAVSGAGLYRLSASIAVRASRIIPLSAEACAPVPCPEAGDDGPLTSPDVSGARCATPASAIGRYASPRLSFLTNPILHLQSPAALLLLQCNHFPPGERLFFRRRGRARSRCEPNRFNPKDEPAFVRHAQGMPAACRLASSVVSTRPSAATKPAM